MAGHENVFATVVNGSMAIRVVKDEIADSPRGRESLGVIAMRETGGYNDISHYGERTYRCDECGDRPMRCKGHSFGDLARIPLFIDNWGWKTVVRTAPNGDDEAPDGYIYATRKRAVEMECVNARGSPSAKKAREWMRQEIDEYNQYLAGEVYAFEMVRTSKCDKGHTHEDVVESAGGFYPPFDGNTDPDGRCRWDPRAFDGPLNHPADYVVHTAIDDFVSDREIVGWARAAARCGDLSDDARGFWSNTAARLAAAGVGGGK